MTSIRQALHNQLHSLYQLLERLDNTSYTLPSALLSNATIGQHMRHIIELLQCLENGYDTALVNYDNRNRDKAIEADRHYAMQAIEYLLKTADRPDKTMLLEGSYLYNNQAPTMATSTYTRELIYNIEHCVHHMALIKVGLNELGITIPNEEFGVASATIQYRKSCAQ